MHEAPSLWKPAHRLAAHHNLRPYSGSPIIEESSHHPRIRIWKLRQSNSPLSDTQPAWPVLASLDCVNLLFRQRQIPNDWFFGNAPARSRILPRLTTTTLRGRHVDVEIVHGVGVHAVVREAEAQDAVTRLNPEFAVRFFQGRAIVGVAETVKGVKGSCVNIGAKKIQCSVFPIYII